MVWSRVLGAYVAPYIVKKVKNSIVKNIIYGEIDDFMGQDGWSSENITGIKELNSGEKSIDSYACDYIMEKDVSEWSDYDYQFLRMTKDYDSNLEKRKKVLEYLNYQKGLKKNNGNKRK